ncbi:MAG: esterase [Burkholderiales bacterium PBB4]|nr:MAG: esterase [Burkholderiales bacterium PBB4]
MGKHAHESRVVSWSSVRQIAEGFLCIASATAISSRKPAIFLHSPPSASAAKCLFPHPHRTMSDLSLILQEPAESVQLILLCHAAGDDAASLMPLGERLCETFPQATVVSLQANAAADAPQGFAWFSLAGITEENRPARIAQALSALQAAVREWQSRSGVSAAATALVGLAQGADMVLEASKHMPPLASRIVAMGGRFTTLPDVPPLVTTIHLLHGKHDTQVPYAHTINAAHRLRDLGTDLIELAVTKLSTHIAPHLWTTAEEAASVQAKPADEL